MLLTESTVRSNRIYHIKTTNLFIFHLVSAVFFCFFFLNKSYNLNWLTCSVPCCKGEICLGMALFLLLRLQSIQGPGARARASDLLSSTFITESWGRGCNRKTAVSSPTTVNYDQKHKNKQNIAQVVNEKINKLACILKTDIKASIIYQMRAWGYCTQWWIYWSTLLYGAL